MTSHRIIPREEWGAVYSDGYGTSTLPAHEVWLHHSVTIAPDLVAPFTDDYAAVRQLEKIGQQRFGRGISYTFVVTPAGLIFEGHSVEREGAHTKGRNDIARAIVLVGNYDVDEVTPEAEAAVAWLLAEGHHLGWWTAPRLNGGHQQAPGASTACPGRHGMEAIPRINQLAAGATGAGSTPQEDEVALTDADVEKIAQRTRQVVADGNRRYGLDTLRAHLVAIRAQLSAGVHVDLDEAAVAKELVPLILPAVNSLPAGTLHELTAALITEAGRRLASVEDGTAPPLAAVPDPEPAPLVAAVNDWGVDDVQEPPAELTALPGSAPLTVDAL